MEFNKYLLEEVCTLITDGSHSSPKAVDVGYDMLSVKDMQDFDFNYSNSKKIAENDYLYLVKNNCQPIKDDVLIAKDGNSCLESCFVFRENRPVVLLSSIAILRPDKEIVDPYYLMYILRLDSTKKALKDGYLSGSAIPRVVLKDFKRFPVYLPPLEEQKKIVNIIYNINSKIENNIKIINTIEEISKVLFKYWFIDFEFPNEEGQPYKTSGGEMVNSELGEIPSSFKTGNFKDILELKYGKSLVKKNRIPGEYPVYGSGGITGTHVDYLITGPGLIIGRKGSIGTLYLEFNNFYPIDTVFYVESEIYEPTFLYLLFKQYDFTKSNNDSAVPGLNRDFVYNTKIIIPMNNIVREFQKIITPIYEQIENTLLETKKLQSLRDFLLPKLISGEIKISKELEV